MRILMTTDAVGGVWQYSLALARGLVEQHGCRVALVCFGEPSERDLCEAVPGGGVELIPLRLKLEWMPDSVHDVQRGLEEVERLAGTWRADLLHSNQFCFGLARTAVPKVVVAHSDLLGWKACHRWGELARGPIGEDGPPEEYSRLVGRGLAGASVVVTPSRFMARSLELFYDRQSRVIHNGLWPSLYPSSTKDDLAVVAGRLWDESKRAGTAVEAVAGLPLRLDLVGPTGGPSGEAARLPAAPNARYLGRLSWRATRQAIARARFYLATSSYEPFGLAALEAALCGCALLANDTASYQELWGGAATFYRRNDAADLREKLAALLETPDEAERLGEAARLRAQEMFTADRMAAEYHRLYTRVVLHDDS